MNLSPTRFYHSEVLMGVPYGKQLKVHLYSYETTKKIYDIGISEKGEIGYRINSGDWVMKGNDPIFSAIKKHFNLTHWGDWHAYNHADD